jgi:hypothetical protein
MFFNFHEMGHESFQKGLFFSFSPADEGEELSVSNYSSSGSSS